MANTPCSDHSTHCCIFYDDYYGCKANPGRFKEFLDNSFEIMLGEYTTLPSCKYYITEDQLITLLEGIYND